MILILAVGLILFALFFIQKMLIKLLVIGIVLALLAGVIVLDRLESADEFTDPAFVYSAKNIFKIFTLSV